MWLIDRLGRRTLLYIGSFGYISSLGLCSLALFIEHFSIVPACIFEFIASHAIGQGAVIWVFISEIFTNCFPAGVVFVIYTGMMVLQLVWVKMMVPETKGVSLEGQETKLIH